METWHADIEDFLELRDNTGDPQQRTYNLNIANWVPDLFMKRVKEDGLWSLFDPKDAPQLCELYGPEFEKAYLELEQQGRYKKQIKARELYAKMMKTLAETGNGWMTFKDACNLKCNQTGHPGYVVHSSNLCTEIVEVTSPEEVAVCNLGSINLARHVTPEGLISKTRPKCGKAIKYLDRVIDINFYPIEAAQKSNLKWRPVGLGVMGLQDVFFTLMLPFDSEPARQLSKQIAEHIYYHALKASVELAKKHGPCPNFHLTRTAQGILQFDLWGITPQDPEKWDRLRQEIRTHGLRNSLLIAIAPTATIASIVGCYESIEPQVSNLFKETLSGEFLQINKYLIQVLKSLGLWNEQIRQQIKLADGSIQHIPEIPDNIKQIFRTAWEIPMKSLIDMMADRAPFIDQSASLNLFMENPTIGKLSSMYMYAWEKGLKTTYYLRSRPATRIAKSTIKVDPRQMVIHQTDKEPQFQNHSISQATQAVTCSLENPETCEACQ